MAVKLLDRVKRFSICFFTGLKNMKWLILMFQELKASRKGVVAIVKGKKRLSTVVSGGRMIMANRLRL